MAEPDVDQHLAALIAEEQQRAHVNGHDARTASPHSWRPVDLGTILDGTYQRPEPTIGERTDGAGILYPGRRHDAYGESESGKTWFALLIAAAELARGNAAVAVDFEDDPAAYVARLRALDVPLNHIRDRFAYIRPDEPLTALGNDTDFAQALGDLHPTVGIVDGVTEAMTMHGLDLKDNADIATFGRLVPGRIAAAGAAALCLDHVTKDREGSRRYAIGGQHKLAGLNGAAFLIENRAAFGIGMTGRSSVYITKDRPAGLRHKALPSSGGLHWFGDLTVGPVDRDWPDHLSGAIAEPARRDDSWKPTELMRQISAAMVKAGTDLTQRDILDRVNKKAENVRHALAVLIDDGFIEVKVVARGAKMHHLVKPFDAAGGDGS